MLSVDSPASPVVLGIVFGLLLVALVINAVVKDRREYRRFAQLTSSKARRRTLGKWLLQSFLFFGGASVVTLVLAAQFVPVVLEQVDAIGWVADARVAFASSWIGPTVTAVVIVALVIAMVLGIVAARRETDIPSIGDVQALLPRNRRELPYGVALSINAGIVEELLFRVAMPAVLIGFTGNALLAVTLSVLVFGALHAYQGAAGIIGATIIGILLTVVYLASESILVTIIVHAVFDLRSLVLIPVIVTRAHRVEAQD